MGDLIQILEMAIDVTETGGSLNDFIDRVRFEFERQFQQVDGVRTDGIALWVSDVFLDHCIVRSDDDYWSVAISVTDDAVEFAPRKDWQPVKVEYVAEQLMPMGKIHEVMVISEFKGKYPDVPLASDIDYDALVDGDDAPSFVTLPIGKANVTSGNKRYYDEEFLKEMERQVIADHPVGIMGHLTQEQAATAFPSEAVHWVGAKRVGDVLWGKGYVPPGEARTRIKRHKATNRKIATSIMALAEGKWDAQLKAFRMEAKSLKLNQIDFAPADRAGISDLAVVPYLTTEMISEMLSDLAVGLAESGDSAVGSDSGNGNNNLEDSEMERDEVIKSIKPEEVPEDVRKAIASEAATAAVQELRSELGLADGADVVATVKEMQEADVKRTQETVKAKITELVNGGVKLEKARGVITELVAAKAPKSVEEAETAYNEVVKSEAIVEMLGEQVKTVMGPNQTTSVQGQSGSGKFKFNIPKEETASAD